MLRPMDPRPRIYVEGPSDEGVLRAHLDGQAVQVRAVGAKTELLALARLLGEHGGLRAAALADSDLDQYLGLQEAQPGPVVFTDHYDLVADMVAIRPHLLDRVGSVLSGGRAASYRSTKGGGFGATTLCAASWLNAFRLASRLGSWSVSARSVDASDALTWSLLADPAAEFARVARVDAARKAERAISLAYDSLVRSGAYPGAHDIARCGTALIREMGVQISSREFERALLAAVDCETFARARAVAEAASLASGDRQGGICQCPHE